MPGPMKCPRCGEKAVKEIIVRTLNGASLAMTKGTMDYECGSRLRWEFEGIELRPKMKMIQECAAAPKFGTFGLRT